MKLGPQVAVAGGSRLFNKRVKAPAKYLKMRRERIQSMIDPYIAGVFFGDGTTYKRKDGTYCVWIDQVERNKRVLELGVMPRIRKMGLKAHLYQYYVKRDRTTKWRVLVYSKDFYIAIRNMFARITEYFSKLSDEEAVEFIAGLFDAEGTKTDRIVIYNQNLKLLNLIRERLEKLGIRNVYVYKFASVYGLQIYRKKFVKKFLEKVPSIRLKARLPG